MDRRYGSSVPPTNNFQGAPKWVPATPARAGLSPIWIQNMPAGSGPRSFSQGVGQVNQLEFRSFLPQPEYRDYMAACCGSTNSAVVVEYGTCQAAVGGAKSGMCGDNVTMSGNLPSNDGVEKWKNVSFGDLLALAHAAGSSTPGENAKNVNEGAFTGNGSSSSLVIPQGEDGSSICSKFPFDLNSPTRMTDEVLSSSNALQFEPITPDQIKSKGQASEVSNLDINKTTIARQEKSIEDALKSAEANDSRRNRQSRLVSKKSKLEESNKLATDDELDAELINTPQQQKPKRKKHRPKVVLEGQPKRTPKPRTPQQHSSKQTDGEKRKYVLRNKVVEPPTTPPDKVFDFTSDEDQPPSFKEFPRAKRTNVRRGQVNKTTRDEEEGTADPPKVSRPRRSCKRSLNFDFESISSDENSSDWHSSTVEEFCAYQSNSSAHLGKGTEATAEKTESGTATVNDIRCPMNQELTTYLRHHEVQFSGSSTSKKIDLSHDKFTMDNKNEMSRGKCKIIFSDETHDKQASILEMTPKSPNSSNCSSTVCLIQGTPERALKRPHPFRTVGAETCSTNFRGAYFNSMQSYQAILPANETSGVQEMHFPESCKRKRTEKSHPSVKSYTNPWETNWLSLSQRNVGFFQASTSANDKANSRMQYPELIPAFVEAEKLRRKRSKGTSKVRDLASLVEICKNFTTHVKERHPITCMESLIVHTRAIMKTKKRSRRGILVSSTGCQMYAQQKFSTNARGSLPAIAWRSTCTIEEISQRLQYLDLNRDSSQDQEKYAGILYQNKFQAENALVIYQRDGSIVPFAGSFVRKRRPRPKVDLDDETTRVWKLLLQDINSEGIDGTDEDKARWWEAERGVFQGRANSFVARMRLVQGDRRFSPWKGSVVDSVVGVFLTQNVSDHLSSSAFMSLAARFPLNTKSGAEEDEESTGILIEEPDVSEPDPDEKIGWPADQSSQPTAESNDQETTVHSSESSENSNNCASSTENYVPQQPGSSRESSCCFLGDQVEPDDLFSSPDSEHSSQPVQTSETTESNNLSRPTSFLKLLQLAGTSEFYGVHDQKSESENILPEMKINVGQKHVACHSHFQKDDENLKSSLGNVVSSYSDSCMVPNLGAEGSKSNNLEEAANFLDLSRELSIPKQSKLSAESVNQAQNGEMRSESYISRDNLKADTETIDVPKVNLELQIQTEESNHNVQQVSEAPALSEAIVDVRREQASEVVDSCKSDCTELRSNSNNGKNHAGGILDRANDKPKAKKERPGKEKQNVDWDSLRLDAQNNGKNRERTANTMDSVDWDAVRCADVNEIAYTIRDRGMNNMLAERIKEFLNRIFREHGSTDLEWLRDVPPDKAKEYLLSFRGLGLKSVECVRLLTLHHLAFPVDTNVGRIAVRLGWVPLQPLPESLQLHLLELYPVLESIQKYLWPRLCKLDQKTLYELHYHMITFGKVFCTKSKPNCNSCPMRGECRHFASAFASARLSLPAPEEKRIVSATDNAAAGPSTSAAAGPSPSQNISQQPMPLPLSQANQSVDNPKLIDSTPIIEVPATPEPIVEEPATPEPEQKDLLGDIEDAYFEDPDEIPTIELDMAEFTQNVKKFVEKSTELQQVEMSKALVALTPEAASIPTPKLKHISHLRTEHQVYELPDSHPLLEGFDEREPDDPSSYLLAIWTPGETVDSIQPPGKLCNSQETGTLCNDETCFACNSIREAHSQTVRGTVLIPCRTAMRGSFPLNGTYFQVNEVFADHDSSLKPIDVLRAWLWNLPRRTVYFGTSIPTIFKGLPTESIQHCFWRGFVCVRGFDKKTRAPRPLIARLHFPASKLTRTKGNPDDN